MKIAAALLMTMGASASLAAQSQRSMVLKTDRAAGDSSWTLGLAKVLAARGTSDLVLLWPGAPAVRGMASVQQLMTAAQAVGNLTSAAKGERSPSRRIAWEPIGIEISSDSTLAATWGVTVAESGSGAPVIDRYIGVWVRARGEGWKLAVLMVEDVGEQVVPEVAELPRELPPISPQGNSSAFVQADRDFARLAGDSGAGIAFERWAAPDVHIFAGGGVQVNGPAAVGRMVAGPSTWAWHPVAAGSSADGTLGWTAGEAVITTAGKGNPTKYLTIWRRQPDGTVRFVTDGGNARPSPAH